MNFKSIAGLSGYAACFFALAFAPAVWKSSLEQSPVPIDHASIQVFFSPSGGCQDAVIREIDAACSEVLVQAYSFTSKPVMDALIRAKDRGVHVRVCCDDSNKNPDTSIADDLADAKIEVRLDGSHPISHSKFVVIDKTCVTTGSWNFSRNAERNSENLLVIKSDKIAARYRNNWMLHNDHSRPINQ